MTSFLACPTPDQTIKLPTRGEYYPTEPDPTRAELLDRIARHLLEPLPGPFDRAAELARNGVAQQVQGFYNQARTIERIEALAFPATDAFPRL